MKNFITSSIGQKFFMSITGLFLIVFLFVHLTIYSLLLFAYVSLFNHAAHFMSSNPIMKVLEPVVAFGFILHILYASYLTIKNQMARPLKYKVATISKASWASRNMYILGGLVLVFLVIHLVNFFWKIKFGTVALISYDNGQTQLPDVYSLVAGLFKGWWWYDAVYIVGAIFLFFHLTHGFWSALQTLGWDNDRWIGRVKVMAYIYATLVAAGFALIPITFMLQYLV